jgi:hypothetical protein
MLQSRVRRWFAAGITGALFAAVSLVSAGSVAADGQPLVQPVGNNDPQSSIVVVAPPGTINAGVAYNPITNSGPAAGTVINGQPYNVYGGYAVPVNPGVPYLYYTGGQWVPYNGAYPGYGVPPGAYPGYGVPPAGYYGYGYGYGAPYGCPYGCTAAGPIVGVTSGGAIVVNDVQSGDGSDDYYVVDPKTGKYVETDVNGNPIVGVPRP